MANSKENKVLTENPLLDEIVWNMKMLARGVVLKDSDQADQYETLDSIQNGDMLIAITEHDIPFESFVYTEELLRTIPGIAEWQIQAWAKDNSKIPQNIRPTLLNNAIQQFLTNYEEKNNYYRRLHGEPNYDEKGEWQGLWIDVNTISDKNGYPNVSDHYINIEGTDYQPIHELSLGYSELLYDSGAIENILADESLLVEFNLEKTDLLYLRYIGSKSIDYYDARKAPKFAILYCPPCDAVEVEIRFKELLEANRLCTLYTVYSDAYKFQSVYYDRFMMILIIIQTLIDMIIELPEYIIRRDIFDSRTCQYIFESNGVDYFSEIPIKYQVALVKNLNKLIKFKSTDKCIVDICSIFGCKSIQIFKYYILRDRNVTSTVDAKYISETKEEVDVEGNTTIVNDHDKNYEIKFVKVPILESYDDYIRTQKNIYDYDSVIEGDDYWNGDKQREEVLSEIKNMDFTLLKSKYYSVEALIDITKRTFELVYFMNILINNGIDKSALLVKLPNISTKKKFEVVDVIIALYSLTYIYYGAEDDIMDTQGKVLHILGFNLEADLAAIAEHLYENYEGLTFQDLNIEGFRLPESNRILTFKEVEEIYTTNKNIYDHVRSQLIRVKKKNVYDAYMYIYKSLFIMKLNMDYFLNPDTSEIFETFTDFLYYKDQILASYLANIKVIAQVDKRQEACINAIQSITTYLKDYIDEDLVEYENIFAGLPSVSLDFIKDYIQQVIDFFKSFKIFTHDMDITYLFTDKFKNTVFMIDWILLKYIFYKSEVIKIEDLIEKEYVNFSKEEKIAYFDKVWLYIDTWVYKNYQEFYNSDLYQEMTRVVRDEKEYYSHFDSHETGFEEIIDKFYQMIITLVVSSCVEMEDRMVEKLYTLEKEEFFNEQIQELVMSLLVQVEYHEGYAYKLKDSMLFNLHLDYDMFVGPRSDRFHNTHCGLELTDETYRMQDNYYKIITNDVS